MRAVSLTAVAAAAFVFAACADKPVEQVKKQEDPAAPPAVVSVQASMSSKKISTVCKGYKKELGNIVSQLATVHAADLKATLSDAKDALDIMVADACK